MHLRCDGDKHEAHEKKMSTMSKDVQRMIRLRLRQSCRRPMEQTSRRLPGMPGWPHYNYESWRQFPRYSKMFPVLCGTASLSYRICRRLGRCVVLFCLDSLDRRDPREVSIVIALPAACPHGDLTKHIKLCQASSYFILFLALGCSWMLLA